MHYITLNLEWKMHMHYAVSAGRLQLRNVSRWKCYENNNGGPTTVHAPVLQLVSPLLIERESSRR